jgi:Fic-DOC domain mobile mystery protein B
MGLELEYIKGQTPIDDDEMADLKIKTISTRGELDEFEQVNIQKAIGWSLKTTFPVEKILTIAFIKDVHSRMFSEVWKWAGSFRKTNKNIGVDKFQIEQELHKLIDDCRFWIDNREFSKDETAIRFKHRLVSIHPFPNGNGRHSRLCADILISKGLGEPIFSWGGKSISESGESRGKYLDTIYKADEGSIKPLIAFARS